MWIKRLITVGAFALCVIALSGIVLLTVNQGKLPFFNVTLREAGELETEESGPLTLEPAETEKTALTLEEILNGGAANENVTAPEEFTFDTEEAVLELPPEVPLAFLATSKIHEAYIQGYNDGSVRPEGNITRAEACQIIYNLLESRPSDRDILADVSPSDWYYDAVALLAAYDVIEVEDDCARPNDPMTRAEFISALTLFFPDYPDEDMSSDFTDISKDSRLYLAVSKAVYFGFIGGYPDGTFRPDATITRAEVMKIMNRALSRMADPEAIDAKIAEEGERFTDLTSSHWAYYEILEATVPHSFDVKGGQEVWSTAAAIREEEPVEPVPVEPAAAEPEPETPTTDNGETLYTPGPVIDGAELYWADESGHLVSDTMVNNLYFGSDGRYTTGDTEVDGYIKDILNSITTPEMTRDQKLSACYVYVRDGYFYLRRNYYDIGATGWELEEARTMLTTGKGNCYCYTGVFCLLARQLGYPAVGISGLVGVDYQQHAWVEIEFDGEPFIFDTTLESSYRERGYDYNFYWMSYAAVPWPYEK